MRSFSFLTVLTVLLVISIGCSSNGVDTTTQPMLNPNHEAATAGTQCWGLYEISIDPATLTAEVSPMRSAQVEVNILKFLEAGGANTGLKVSGIQGNPPNLSCNIGIQHPFFGMPLYTGFTVRGLVLTNGNLGGFTDPTLKLSGPTQLRLTNADGYTRWMNPSEFPFDDTILNYRPGIMGDPEGNTYTSTINPYKLFADDLNNIQDNMDLNEAKRAQFSSGKLNWRKYNLNFGSQPFMKFQYAVVASWEFPTNDPPNGYQDFPVGTVDTAPWQVDVEEISNDLYWEAGVQGGALSLRALVRDFENADQDSVFIEAPGFLPRQQMTKVNQDGEHLTFELDVQNITLTTADDFEVLVAAVAGDGTGWHNRIPGKEMATYRVKPTVVADHAPQAPDWPFFDDFENYDYIWTAYGGGNWGSWGKANGIMDAAGGGDCFEEDTGSDAENLNVSYVATPAIAVPASSKDLLLTFHHTIQVDPVEEFGYFAWDMCYVRIDGQQIFPTAGPAYEDDYYPWTFDPIQCWTNEYAWSDSTFNLGTSYNGTTVHIEFVLDTYDYINNCDPPFFGWHVDDVGLDFAQ